MQKKNRELFTYKEYLSKFLQLSEGDSKKASSPFEIGTAISEKALIKSKRSMFTSTKKEKNNS